MGVVLYTLLVGSKSFSFPRRPEMITQIRLGMSLPRTVRNTRSTSLASCSNTTPGRGYEGKRGVPFLLLFQ